MKHIDLGKLTSFLDQNLKSFLSRQVYAWTVFSLSLSGIW